MGIGNTCSDLGKRSRVGDLRRWYKAPEVARGREHPCRAVALYITTEDFRVKQQMMHIKSQVKDKQIPVAVCQTKLVTQTESCLTAHIIVPDVSRTRSCPGRPK